MRKSNKDIFWLLLACLLVFFVNLDAIFVNIMEARNFITAREMLQNGNWIFTTINELPRYEKPPLPTWLTAISASIFGLENLYAMRLPAAVLGTVSVLMTYQIALKITQNKSFAFISGLVAVTSFYILLSSRDGQWDIFTHGFMLVSILFIIKLFSENEHPFKNALIAGLFFGFSFLSKGPVSLYALLLPFLIAYGVVFKFKKGRVLPLLTGLLVAAVVSASWNVYVYLFDTHTVKEITTRETGNWLNYNVRPFYYYWSFFVQSGLWTIPAFISLLYPYLKNRVFDKKAYQFSLLWTLAAVVLLSIIPEKKSRYLLPVLFPLAINTAFYIEYLFRSFKSLKAKETWPVYLHFGIISLIGLAFPVAGFVYFGESLEGSFMWYLLSAVSLFGLGAFILLNLFRKNIKKSFYGTVLFIAAIICFGLPLAKAINPNPDYRGPEVLNKPIQTFNVPVYEFYNFAPELIWVYGRAIPVLHNGNDYQFPKENDFLLLVEDSESERNNARSFFENYHLQQVDSIDVNPVAKKKARLKRVVYYVEKL